MEPNPIAAHPPALDDDLSDRLATELADVTAQLSAARLELGALREALQAAAAREQLLANEVQHRVNNMLAVLRSIFRRTFEGTTSQKEFAEHFEGRLNAIARYQASIAEIRFGGVELEDMVRDELFDVHCAEGPNCTIAGPPVRLQQKTAELMSLAIHELTTNAVKFGALCHDGRLSIDWSLDDTPTGRMLRFRWKETNVPLVSAAPRAHGFGQDFIEEGLRYQIGATTSFAFKPGGLACAIDVPLPASATPPEPDWDAADEAFPFSELGSELS